HGGRAGPPAAPAPGGLHRPAGRAGGGPAQGPGPVGQGPGRDGGRPWRGMGPGGAAARPGPAQRPRPHVGAPAHQGARAGPRRGPRPPRGEERPPAARAPRLRREKWWYDVPGRREVRDGPSNWKVVLAGETDTLVRGSE